MSGNPVRRLLAGTLVAAPVAAALTIAGPAPVRIPAGLLLALLLPGLAVTAALFARRADAGYGVTLSVLERLMIVAGTSLAVPAVGGLALHAARIRLDRISWAALAVAVTTVAAVVGLVRSWRRDGPAAGAPVVPRPARPALGKRVALLGVAVAVLAGAGLISVHSSQTRDDSRYTALWLSPVAQSRTARTVEIGVTNAERADVGYTVSVSGGTVQTRRFAFSLRAGSTWRSRLSVPADGSVAVNLYKDGLVPVYRSVFLDRQHSSER
jgi:uncharacterized membrane protein